MDDGRSLMFFSDYIFHAVNTMIKRQSIRYSCINGRNIQYFNNIQLNKTLFLC